MQSKQFSRRALAFGLASLPVAICAAQPVTSAVDGLTHDAEAIQQVIVFDASPQRVYDALTKTRQFDAVTRLSDAATLLAATGAKPTDIGTQLGGTFTLFGGYVVGRHLEMLPSERLVQAWRAGSWQPGEYSIATFALAAQGAKTKLTFDHCGFPNGNGVSLAKGWYSHYWGPLAKFLAQS